MTNDILKDGNHEVTTTLVGVRKRPFEPGQLQAKCVETGSPTSKKQNIQEQKTCKCE